MKLVEMGSIALAEIEVGNRLRALDEDVAQGLAAMIKATGLQNPVQLLKSGNVVKLAAGRHRLRAFEILQRASIPAHVWETEGGEDEAACLRMIEIVENVGRRELSALDRAAHIAELQATYLALYGEQRGGDQKSAKSKVQHLHLWSLEGDVAEKMGLSRRTIFADLELFKGLTAASRKRLAGTKFAANRAQLVALAQEEADDQKAILDLIFAPINPSPNVKHAAALHHNEIDSTTPDERHWKTFMALWGKCSKKIRNQIHAHVVKNMGAKS